jgi:preprotein translocase subunit SecB
LESRGTLRRVATSTHPADDEPACKAALAARTTNLPRDEGSKPNMNENAQAQGNTSEQSRKFAIQRLYLKDVSLETPNSPHIFREKWTPQLNVNLSSTTKDLEPAVYEVVLSVTATVKSGDSTAYLAEVQQAGIFSLEGFSRAELGPMLGSYCPNILFPFAREAVSDLVIKAGFPQLLLAPVNFDALYAQHVQAQGGGDGDGKG